ncbi:MAG: transporter ATP-binding protein [Actinomycetota bacterium]|nr:transporter ATP-binding protein [Actinomycetota bacterium]
MTGVRVTGITAQYGPMPVLTDLSLDASSGEVLAVLGASGSGKTTLLRVLAGFLRPTAGEVSFGDRVVSGPSVWVPPEHRRVGIVPQEGALFPHLDVRGNVGFGLPRHSDERVEQMLALVGMSGMGARRVQALSGGQQQRVALARALAPEPDVLLLDEPFSALDASMRVRLRGEVREVLAETGTTTVLVTHDQEEALSFADRVAVVRDGRVVQVAGPDDLYERPVDLDTARFVGDVVELDAVMAADGTASCALGTVPVIDPPGAGVRGVIVLRPEQLAVADDAGAQGAPGRVRSCSYHGHDSVLLIELDGGIEVLARTAGRRGAAPGDRVRVVAAGPALLFTRP